MRIGKFLALIILCFMLTIKAQQSAADDAPPPPEDTCDDQCRQRQYFYFPPHDNYFKYETTICVYCINNGLCLPTKKDGDVTKKSDCVVPAGKERANKYWEIESTTICTFLVTAPRVECKPEDPANEYRYRKTAITECRAPKPPPNPNPNPGPPSTTTK
jgi:putative hemolysin